MRRDNDTSVQPQLSQWGRLAAILEEAAKAYENGQPPFAGEGLINT